MCPLPGQNPGELAAAPIGLGRSRGYRFTGTGDYGPLLGTALAGGVPEGKPRRRSVFRFALTGVMRAV